MPQNEPIPFKTTTSEIVWSCPWYQIRRDDLLLPNGNDATYFVVDKAAAVTIIPVTPEGEIVLIRQYRHTVGVWNWEIPAGSVPDGLAPKEAAEMELLEEIGGKAGRLEKVTQFFTANGICNEETHVFVAFDVELGDPDREQLEQIVIYPKPVAEVLQMAQAGEIKDALSALSLLLSRPILEAAN